MHQPLKTLSLFPGEPKSPPHSPLTSVASTRRPAALWIAVCAPRREPIPAEKPEKGLQSLAIWSRTLTPTVSFAPPDALLLEVQGSLRLFGGLESVKSALLEQADKRCSTRRIGIAPTANGALWLSRHESCEALTLTALRSCLRSLPITVTRWPEAILVRLADMGVDRIGDLLRLPRDGLGRRIGIAYLRDLDKALGRESDLRAVLELPESLSLSVDLAAETADSGLLLEAAGELLERMTLDLLRQQRQIRELSLRFEHLHGEPSIEPFELLEPAHEKQRFLDLLVHRFERVCLRAPVVAIALKTGDLLDMHMGHRDLFPGASNGRYELSAALIERLRERFGPKNVYGIARVADHRPESAWSKVSAGCRSQESPSARERAVNDGMQPAGIEERPLWLLKVPRRLRVADGRPIHRGALRLQVGPERIEGGWWDQRDISRDYFSALGESGEKLWIYRDNATARWYLHGIFG